MEAVIGVRLPAALPPTVALMVADDLEAALEEFRALAESLAEVGIDLEEGEA